MSEKIRVSILEALNMPEYKNGIPENDFDSEGLSEAENMAKEGIIFGLVTNSGTFYKRSHEQ